MITKVHIENFRCFESFELEGFARVNLIGGTNNSGKTALLEGIYLGDEPFEKIGKILHFRNENIHALNQGPEPFRSLFKDYQQAIHIKLIEDKDKTNFFYFYLSHQELPDEKLEKMRKEDHEPYTSNPGNSLILIRPFDRETLKHFGTYILDSSLENLSRFRFAFLPANLSYLKSTAFNNFKQDEKDDKTAKYLEAIRVIDHTITEIRTQADDNRIQLKKNGYVGLHPINYLGDAVVKVVTYISFLQGRLTKMLLIDEIENGLHYTKHEEFWKIIFKLAIERDIQIMATTHSLEMITAFNKAAISNGWQNEARYIEMYRQEGSGKIGAIVRDMEALQEDISDNLPFRGETYVAS